MQSVFLLIISLYAVVQGAQIATKYAEKVAESFHMSRYIVGFIIVSTISVLPELFVAANATLRGNEGLGIGVLFGSNVADLTLIVAILVFVAGRGGIRIDKSAIRKLSLYPMFLLIPLALGFDGVFTRAEGVVLIIAGLIFYITLFRKSVGVLRYERVKDQRLKHSLLMLLGLVMLLAGAHFTVEGAIQIAGFIGMTPALVGLLIVSLGTTIPELFFSAKAIRSKKPEMAIGDIFGSVLADATIVIGLIAIIKPLHFPVRITYIAGITMVIASLLLLLFMRSRLRISKREAFVLIGVWVSYVALELMMS